jgi:hypothetical protein
MDMHYLYEGNVMIIIYFILFLQALLSVEGMAQVWM